LTFVSGAVLLSLEAFGKPASYIVGIEHAHAGFVGWLVNTVIGVAYWLLPANRAVSADPRTLPRADRPSLVLYAERTVALGFALSIGLSLGRAFVVLWAPVHAMLGLIGWQSLLVAGVSVRTYARIVRKADRRAAHIVISSLVLVGLLLWTGARLAHAVPVEVAGDALIVAGGIIYAASTLLLLRGPGNPHRLPREFVAASAFWLVIALCYGLASYGGAQEAAVFVFVLLVGYIGQNVNARLMHVGIRLLSTLVISEEDETQPGLLLDRRVGLAFLILYQAAVACGAIGLTFSIGSVIEVAAILGFLGTVAMMAKSLLRLAPLAKSPFEKDARSRRFERPTFPFGGGCSIQLSYERTRGSLLESRSRATNAHPAESLG
jgi:hypothetical protein